jgi:hypothetical protein
MEKKIMKVLTVTNDRSKCSILEQSLQTFGWDYDIIEGDWRGYSTKLHGIYAYLKANSNVKDFIFTDAFDTMFTGKEFIPIADNFVSGEVNCWTGKDDPETAKLFTSEEKFKYPNSGGFYMQSNFFIKIFEDNTPLESDDDQKWLIDMVLKYNISIDYNCTTFQTLYKITPKEFRVKDGKLINNSMGTTPLVLHGNGGVNMEFYHNLFKAGRDYLVKMPKITIGVPTRGEVHVKTVGSILNAIFATAKAGYEIGFDFETGTYLHYMRNEIVNSAINNGSDYLMFVDADLEFPHDGLLKLLSHKKDVVGGCYNTRALPLHGTVKKINEKGEIYTCESPTNLEQVYAIPTGFMLINLHAIRYMAHPFDFGRFDDGAFIGEDINFCKRFNEMGREIWCDGSISIGHIGEYTY